jgi:hypothetical protein
MQLDDAEATSFMQYCGTALPISYRWNLCHFCWSFMSGPVQEGERLERLSGTPVVLSADFISHLPEIKKWAEVTEQLLTVFKFTQKALGKSWRCIPATHLLEKWDRTWNTSLGAGQPGRTRSCEPEPRRPIASWDWSEFKDSLRLRERLWEQKMPRKRDSLLIYRLASHMGLRGLGLNLCQRTDIRIV